MAFLLGIDQGTSGTTAVVFDETLTVRSEAYRAVQPSFPRPGHVEHDPLALVDSVAWVAAEALRKAGIDRVEAVGLANQGETTLAWDGETGEPLSPAIVWQDRRTEGLLADLRRLGLAEEIERCSRLPLDPYFSASKIAWLMGQTEVAAAARSGRLRIGTSDAFLRDKLVGRYETDPATASRTQLLDLASASWDRALCASFEVPAEVLPAIAPTCGDLGELDQGPLLAAIVDQQAALAGQGCFMPGEAKCTYGTGCFLLVNAGESLPETSHGLLPTIAWGRDGSIVYALDGGVLSAGTALSWLAAIGVLAQPADADSVASTVSGSDGVFFLPALVGLGAPWWRSTSRGVLSGVGPGTQPGHIVRAVLEGIALRIRDIVDAANATIATPLTSLRIDGGLAQSRVLVQAQADLLGISIEVSRHREATALGAAVLAGAAAGVLPSPTEVASLLPEPEIVTPKWSADQRETVYAGWDRFVRKAMEL